MTDLWCTRDCPNKNRSASVCVMSVDEPIPAFGPAIAAREMCYQQEAIFIAERARRETQTRGSSGLDIRNGRLARD